MKNDVDNEHNMNSAVVADFGHEWERYDQRNLREEERMEMFRGYFAIFPWDSISADSVGFDAGCGSGRWAVLVAPRVGHLHCLDPSGAIEIAKQALCQFDNCSFYKCSIEDMPIPDESMDFGYSLGVLHHLPDARSGITSCVRKLKIGAPFLVYIYYAFDNRPYWFRVIWRFSDLVRRCISRSPRYVKVSLCLLIASLVYFPFSRIAKILDKVGIDTANFPLSAYKNRSFYSMKTDSLDRFGTRLEHRFTRQEIRELLREGGLDDIQFSPNVPYWCAVGYRKK